MATWYDKEMIPTERIALVVWRLTRGETLTAKEIAEEYGCSHSGAWRLLARVSRVIPIYQKAGYWWVLPGALK